MKANEEAKMECSICLGVPKLPVATQCGHIYCWNCIKEWISKKKNMECPICKNGISLEKLVKLYIGNNDKDEVDDRPNAKREPPIRNNNYSGIYRSILNSLGFYGQNNSNNNLEVPDQKEVIRNRLSLLVFIFGIIIIFYIFK